MAIRPASRPQRPLSALSTLLGVRLDPATAAGNSHPPNDLGFLSGLTLDSRSVEPGDLYVALPGARVHGAAYCADAVAAGAVAVLTDPDGRSRAVASGVPVFVLADPRGRLGEIACWVYGDPSSRLRLIGVTGTSGKTTSTYLIESGLRAAGHRSGLVGGVEIRVGPQRLASALTTPEAPDLQALFAVMAERGVTAAAMEVSSHSLALGRVAGTRFDVAVFTNLSQDHLDFHADLEDYFRAKASLFRPPALGVINIDDKHGRRLAAAAPVPVTTFSASGADGADWRAVDVRSGADGSTFQLVGPGGVEADASVGLAGVFNVANAVGALVALVEAGIRLEDAVAGVAACPGVPGRLERVPAAGLGLTAFVDYSHKPGAVEAVLRSLRPVTQGNLIIVLGCGGDRDRAKRPMMGAAAASLADVAILTSDNPRSEDPLAILAAMLDGVLSVPQSERGRVIMEPDRAAAIGQAVALAAPGDVIVVAGKGHETGQYVAGAVLPFDDRQVTAEALERRAKSQDPVDGDPVIPLSLAQIARACGGELRGDAAHPVDPGAVVRGEVVIDSRRVRPGGLFAAVAGERADGHDFAAAAVAAGAVAVLATRPVPAPSVLVADVPAALAALARQVVDALPAARVAGITGSSGKTSTKDLAAQLAERLGPTIAPAGSFNNEFGHPLTVLRADASTRYLVLELSARGAGHIAYLCRIAPPRYGVVLNVGHAHAGEFGGLDQVARAKGELVEALPADGVAILNADDPRVLAMAARTAARVVTFSCAPGSAAPVRAADVRLDDAGRPSFTLLTPAGSAPVTLRLHGAHHVPNALAAAALAGELGLGLDGIADGLRAAVTRSRWRMEIRQRADGVTVVNDAYNANPESVRAALDALAHLARHGRGFAVLGHMAELGDISRASHEDTGEYAARVLGPGLAALIAVGEEAGPLLDGARRVPSWTGEALAAADGAAALDLLGNRLKPGDVVLVKASRAARLESVAMALLGEAYR